MSRFYTHTAYAEDQPLPKTILTTHVLTRGFQAGALVGPLLSLPIYFLRKPSPLSSSSASLVPRSLPAYLIRSAGVGSVVFTGLAAILLTARMWGREPIEWADRSWRLLQNKGQVEVDDWGYGGAVLGAVGTYFSGAGMARLGWRGVLGGTGLGSIAGVGGYMIWRHGVNGGKWPEDKSLAR